MLRIRFLKLLALIINHLIRGQLPTQRRLVQHVLVLGRALDNAHTDLRFLCALKIVIFSGCDGIFNSRDAALVCKWRQAVCGFIQALGAGADMTVVLLLTCAYFIVEGSWMFVLCIHGSNVVCCLNWQWVST